MNSNNGKKNGLDFEQLKNAAESGNIEDFLQKNLDSKTNEKIKNVLNDKVAAEKILSSPAAQELLKKLKEGK